MVSELVFIFLTFTDLAHLHQWVTLGQNILDGLL